MRGFTLIEVLVATAILVVLGAAVYTSYISNVETIQAGRSSSEIHQRARIILDLMRRDLESAINIVPGGSGGQILGLIGRNGQVEGRPADRIDFTTLTHLAVRKGDPETDLCSVGYRVEKGEEGDLVLYRRDDGVPGGEITSGGREEEISDRITGLDVVYLDSQGRSSDDWDSIRGTAGVGLPTLVQVSLGLRDQEGKEHFFRTSVHPELSRRFGES